MIDVVGNRSYLLTPPGTAAIAVIRVVGPTAQSIVHRIFQSATDSKRRLVQVGPILYGRIEGPDGESVDDVLVSRVDGHDKADGESHAAFDLTTHGGIRVVECVLEALRRVGAPLAADSAVVRQVWQPRTTIEREVLDALAAAKTERAVTFLAWQRTNLVPALEGVAASCASEHDRAAARLETMASGYSAARLLLNGARIALVGPPNSGKSTLFNRLLGRSAALVSAGSGTTRDWLGEHVEFDGVPIHLLDTAGRHEQADSTEKDAIRAGHLVEDQADLSLVVIDSSVRPYPLLTAAKGRDGEESVARLVVFNKTDLIGDAEPAPTAPSGSRFVRVSSLTGDGIPDLVGICLATLGFAAADDATPCLFTARQIDQAKAVMAVLESDPERAADAIRQELIGA